MLTHTLQLTHAALQDSFTPLLSPTPTPRFRFQPLSHSWVALHPQPQGVIQFIGGAFFGTYPTLFYRRLLKPLFEAGYTIVALPFRFTFDHWSIALSLLAEHYCMRQAIIEAALRQPGYRVDAYLDAASYSWVGHSLGCKYVVLLELLSCPEETLTMYFDGMGVARKQWNMIVKSLHILTDSLRQLEGNIHHMTGQSVNYGLPSIYNEASLLLAPAITDLAGAIPLKPLEKLFSNVLTVYPTVEQTHALIARSRLFNLTHLFEFEDDEIARPTCQRLRKEQSNLTASVLPGTHLAPIRWPTSRHTAIPMIHKMQQLLKPSLC